MEEHGYKDQTDYLTDFGLFKAELQKFIINDLRILKMQNQVLNHVFWSLLFSCEIGFRVWLSDQSAPTGLSARIEEK